MVRSELLNSSEISTVKERVKSIVDHAISMTEQQGFISIEALGEYFKNSIESSFKTEFYFEACDTCFPDLDVYGSSCLTFQESLDLLNHPDRFKRFVGEFDIKHTTYVFRLTFDWVDPAQFQTIAESAIRSLPCDKDGYTEDTLTNLYKCLSWDSIYADALQIKNIQLQAIE